MVERRGGLGGGDAGPDDEEEAERETSEAIGGGRRCRSGDQHGGWLLGPGWQPVLRGRGAQRVTPCTKLPKLID